MQPPSEFRNREDGDEVELLYWKSKDELTEDGGVIKTVEKAELLAAPVAAPAAAPVAPCHTAELDHKHFWLVFGWINFRKGTFFTILQALQDMYSIIQILKIQASLNCSTMLQRNLVEF